MKQKVPTIMYHSVGVVNRKWHWNFLTCPYEIFEAQLKWLKRAGYYTLNFQEIYDYVMNDVSIPRNSVFLTFDDGYLDNYVYAYPLLKKYGMKGSIFVNPDFVDKREIYRRTIDEVNSNEELVELDNIGFCSWSELEKMNSEGILDVQSHAKTHTWYPISDKIIDFRHPDDDYVWMDWNENPREKPNLQLINWNKVKYGQAIFEHEKSLSSKRVYINKDFQKELNNYVRLNGGKSFFENSNWKKELELHSKKIKEKYSIITQKEKNDEYLKRIKYELEYTKTVIEKRLNKQVNFLCWPGGSVTKEGIKIAENLGYLMFAAATRDISENERSKIKNSPDNKVNRLVRFSPVMYNNWEKDNDSSIIKYSPGWFFILRLMRFKNKYYAGIWMKYVGFIIVKFHKFFYA